jgi:hypothetical protein
MSHHHWHGGLLLRHFASVGADLTAHREPSPATSSHAGLEHRGRFDDDGPDRRSAGVAKGQEEAGHVAILVNVLGEDCASSLASFALRSPSG